MNSLMDIARIDLNSVQKHKNVILEFLNDSDIAIKRKSLDLTYLIVNEGNIKQIMKECLNFLNTSDSDEFKAELNDYYQYGKLVLPDYYNTQMQLSFNQGGDRYYKDVSLNNDALYELISDLYTENFKDYVKVGIENELYTYIEKKNSENLSSENTWLTNKNNEIKNAENDYLCLLKLNLMEKKLTVYKAKS